MTAHRPGEPQVLPFRVHIRVRGLVQGVGFRPTVWRIATGLGLSGDVRNDGEGVLIRIVGPPGDIDTFCRRLTAECPPLARIDGLDRWSEPAGDAPEEFRILSSEVTEIRTTIVPDAATCDACREEVFDPGDRRYRYPFTNCTHCGPRLSIVRAIPYDRANTSMSGFLMCEDCRREYENPSDRRFHAQPNACPVCGPQVWLEDREGARMDPKRMSARDAAQAASDLLVAGRIVAIKGIGGFHLACDATNAETVAELRRRKRRFDKPLALMARDLDIIRRHAIVGDAEAELLNSVGAPIVLLDPLPGESAVAPAVAPGQSRIGFMLPYSPLHHLLLSDWDKPLVMTSGNLSDEPQCTDNGDAGDRLGTIADAFLLHDRPILNRVDDSVVRVMDGAPRMLRRARGFSPASLPLPSGFADTPAVLALGGELKTTICLTDQGRAVVSQHLGDLEDARTAEEYERTLTLYRQLFDHHARRVAVDRHPGYRSTQLGLTLAEREGLTLVEVQHHHAHVASVLAENGRPLDASPVLGIALDGLGYGDDGTLWGGEFLLADYRNCRRVGHLKPAPMPGGTRSILEPWRNAWAHLSTHLGWHSVEQRWGDLELARWLRQQPLGTLERMAAQGLNSPLSSSCGRLFDAVAAALNLSRASISYEGQAAIELEALALKAAGEERGYRFAMTTDEDVVALDPAPLWIELLDDLARGVDPARIAMRFHIGLAQAVTDMAAALCSRHHLDAVALSGGVFQNQTLLERIAGPLRDLGMDVLLHRQVPANDGGLSLGQATIAACRE